MIKIIFSDFDNTMLDYYSDNNYFDEYKIGIFKRLKDKGIKFCVVTGRCVSFFRQFPNLMEVIDYIAGSNGSCIYDVVNDKYIYHDSIDNEVLEVITEYLIKNDYSFVLNCRDGIYKYGDMTSYGIVDYVRGNSYSCEQIVIKSNEDRFQDLFKYLETVRGIGINNIAVWDGYWTIDINNKSISKGSAVKWLCDYLGIDVVDAIAFGDGGNDKSMFDVINKGIAVSNAIDKLKIVSKSVTLDCSNNGMYKYIEDNILK